MKVLTNENLKDRYEYCIKNNVCFISMKPLEEGFITLTKEFGLPVDVDSININSKYVK